MELSRKYKFYLFFMCLGLLTVISIYFLSVSEYWIMPLAWIINITNTEKECEEKLSYHSTNNIGLN
jgi:hypothetical protein